MMYNYLLLIVFIVTAVVSIQSKIDTAVDIDDVDNNDDDNDDDDDDDYSMLHTNNSIKTTTTTTTTSSLHHIPVFNPIGMTRYQLVFPKANNNHKGTSSSETEEDHEAISLNLLKSDSSFCSISSGSNDGTASALWGSSVVLSKYIIMMNDYYHYHDNLYHPLRNLELFLH